MKDLPLVSAIITTHNRLDLLKQAIKSVYDQTYENMELIVVDDASSDGTKEYCEAQSFRYIRIPQEESRGGNHARNLGIMAAKGKYVAFLDDDDMWLPEKTVKQVKLLEETDTEIVHCVRRIKTIDGDTISYRNGSPHIKYWGDLHKKILLRYHYPVTSEIMASRKALLETGLYDENLKASQEYELMIRLAQRKPTYYVKEPLIIYRDDINDKSRCALKYQNWISSVKYIYKKHKDLYLQLSIFEHFCEQMRILNEIRRRLQKAETKGWKLYCILIFIVTLPFRSVQYLYNHIAVSAARTEKQNVR